MFGIIFSVVAIITFGFKLVARGNPLLPITPVSDLRLFKNNISNFAREEEKYFKYVMPGGLLLLGVFVLIVNYASGSRWLEAVSMAVLVVMPFHLGILLIYIILVGLELLLLFLRYIIHH